MENSLNFLSTRKSFNISLNHFKIVNNLISKFKNKYNLADLLNEALNNDSIKQYQLKSILNVILIDKFNYYAESFNIKTPFTGNLNQIAEIVEKWSKFDLTIKYHHPQLGELIINPKRSSSWEAVVGGVKENELVVVYIGYFDSDVDQKLASECAKALTSLINNQKIKDDKKFISEERQFNQPAVVESKPSAPAQQPGNQSNPSSKSGVKKKLSPQYGIVVSNELFHNGNVEAWKKIVQSYEAKYPDIKVLIFYDNEQIHDINTLFKWGKVKHGTMIYFRLLGPEFAAISKLRRYLTQGASFQFEAFLKGSPGQILPLF